MVTEAKGKSRKFLLLAGASAVGFFVSVVLHNLVYGLFIVLFGPNFWDRIGLGDEPFFFLLATVVFPIGFLIGTIGSVYIWLKMELKNRKLSLPFVAFLQSVGLVIYCLLVGLVFWKGETWFGKPPHLFLGPVMVLVLFVVSALISALIVLGYPFVLFWEKKKTMEALKLVIYTTAWTMFFIFLIALFLAAC